MSTQPHSDVHAAQVSAETEHALRDFVCAAVSHLSEALKDRVPEWEVDSRWERGPDGHFREHTKRTRQLWPIVRDEWLRSLPGYDTCVERLKSDEVVGPHLDRLVGTALGSSGLKADNILLSAIYAMLNDEGAIAFTNERFDRQWRELVEFFGADRFVFKTVAPLPHLAVPEFPLRLNSELVLDHFTDDEVTRCCQVSVLRPSFPRFPLIDAGVAVGIRRTMFVPKLIRAGDEPRELSVSADEGRFGSRPLWRADLGVEHDSCKILAHRLLRAPGGP